MFQKVLKNGLMIDPKNKIMSKMNLGIANGKITAVTKDEISGEKEYDCSGKIVSPGFVDIHMHEDPYNEDRQAFEICIAECMLKMGVTTVVGGNCGIGAKTVDGYLNEVSRLGYPVNIALLMPHGSLRDYFGNFDKYKNVSSDVIANMCKKLEKELEAGALGLSFGIRYIPGLNREEMLALCRVAKKYDRAVAAHVRDDAAGIFDAIRELIQLALDTGVKIQVSHIGSMAAYGQMEEVVQMIDHYAAGGIDIALDCYPYNAFCTYIGSTVFDEGFLERYDMSYSELEITQGKYKGQRLTEATFREVRENNPEYLAVAHVMKEEEVDMALSHPRTILASDGLLNEGNGHPRAAGSFPRFIREYVLNKRLISLYDAIAKMTYLPASRYGLNKGTLSIGADADIVVFDLEKIRDKASFDKPLAEPEGIDYVFINGNEALAGGKILNNTSGRPIRAM